MVAFCVSAGMPFVAAVIERARMGRRLFFVIMASAVIATVFAGFAPTLYPQDRPMSLLLHVHGIVFGAWVTAMQRLVT
jgi:secreted PhoX family phosphatase